MRIFRALWAGSTISAIGSSAGNLAINWLVYVQTKSAFDLALVGIAGLIPRITFGIFAGTLADRYNRLKLMITADAFRSATMILFALGFVILGFQLGVVFIATFVLGLG
ncbi:MAG: MFS transporter, partial [Nitrososphaerales archaeon]